MAFRLRSVILIFKLMLYNPAWQKHLSLQILTNTMSHTTKSRTHEENRAFLCAVCFKKDKDLRRISDVQVAELKALVDNNFSLENPKYQSVICSQSLLLVQCPILIYVLSNWVSWDHQVIMLDNFGPFGNHWGQFGYPLGPFCNH